ncbi:polyamine ABC transporter substrate-binding protein [Snodgrassella sp. CFCC 13594]|uniref:polyamine ABC transporter substrate-binding protein n=1 Tax=Snodgrassella sp. CFCC 13594 TaxID=1775559 RepID=UPI000833E63E|nr:polyamine ABC transporter substrate-binding protein [Snodgrassella sp. CFCC 13594]
MKVLPIICVSLQLAACGEASHQDKAVSDVGTASANDNGSHVLNMYNWGDYVDPKILTAFTDQYHIKIRQDLFDSNEVLEAKVLTGKSGYDLVYPSLSNLGRQIRAGAYQPLDKSKIPNYKNIDPALLRLLDQVDPGNKYAVPYFWGIYTVGINPEQVKKALGTDKLPENEWDLVFNPEYTRKLKSCGISYVDSPTSVLPLALSYIGKDPNSNNAADLKAAAQMISKVVPDIRRFNTSGYINDFAQGSLCVGIGYNGDFNIANTRAKAAKNGVTVQALVPKQGVGVWIDTMVIPADAKNVDNALKYINWTLEPKIAAQNADFVTYAPGTKLAKQYMNQAVVANDSVFPSESVLARSFVNKEKQPDTVKLAVRLWQQIKSNTVAKQ